MLFLPVLRITPSLQHSCHFRNTAVLGPNVILDEQRKLKKYIKYDIFQTEAHDVRSTIRA
jgi:hypothetical protein